MVWNLDISGRQKLIKDRLVVLHVIRDLFSKGGTPRLLLSLVRAIDSSRLLHIFLVFGNCEDNLNDEMLKAGAVVVNVLRYKNYDVRLLWDIIHMVRTYQADIISTHFARADVYGVLAGILTRKPVIKTVHGILWNSSSLIQWIDHVLSSFRAYTVCNSIATLKAVQKQGSAHNSGVIYNGVPNQAITLSPERIAALKVSFGISPDAFVIGHVGALIPLRDDKVIINALALLSETDSNSYLVLVGDGPLRQQLEQRVASIGLGNRVLFLGNRDDIPELLTMFNVYVNMAIAEGFGIAVVEAMQAGLPVVLANAGALPELIEDGISGLLVSPGDSRALAEIIKRLETELDFAKFLGEQARQRAASEFSIERYGNDIEQIYLQIAHNH